MNNLNFKKIDKTKFPVVNILKFLPDKHSLFETVIVSANDKLVDMFLNDKIKFLDISKILLKVIKYKEFIKYKRIIPKNVAQIEQVSNYVSLKINSLRIYK
jgi:1-deoxy-D-xylulose-5-phosphate reductoisomerase